MSYSPVFDSTNFMDKFRSVQYALNAEVDIEEVMDALTDRYTEEEIENISTDDLRAIMERYTF